MIDIYLQAYNDLNKQHFPTDALYLYQVGFLGSPINQCLRKGIITQTLYDIYIQLMNAFENITTLKRTITVYRGIPSNDVPVLNVGDIFTDAAFTSVTLTPDITTSFGDILFILLLRKEDKLVYLSGDRFYSDVFECVLPAGMRYKIIDIKNSTYIVESIGPRSVTFPMIDYLFDTSFLNIIVPINLILKENKFKPKTDHIALIFLCDSIEVFMTDIEEYGNKINMKYVPKNLIYEWAPFYADFLDNKIEILYTIPLTTYLRTKRLHVL
jgi:hypothetical protein